MGWTFGRSSPILDVVSTSSRATGPSIAEEVLESLHEGCQVIGFDGRYLYVNANAAAQGQSTPEKLQGRMMTECYPGIDATPMFAMLQRSMNARTHERMENEFTLPDDTIGWFELRFVPVPAGVCILSLDVTAAKNAALALARSEAQLRHAQKMEAVGRLAGGVAHDFNNVLSVVLSYANLLLDEIEESDPMRHDLGEIKLAGERAAALTRQLLSFSRQQVLEPRIIDVAKAIETTSSMFRRLVGADVELRTVLAADVGRINADPGHLDQVLMNLVVNARDAMPEGGTLTIEAHNTELDAEYAATHLGVKPGHYVMLAVSDTGTGMDRATQERIFEPFFTTKARGQGTGLGLATVFGIVRQSGGTVWVYSEVGRGTTFKVFLPRTDAPEESAAPPTRVAQLGGTETILLVEDEEQVRNVVRSILVKNGYTVFEAHNGRDAMRVGEEHSAAIDLLLTDVVMPHISGRELAGRLCAQRPGLRVLYMSGYTDDALLPHHVLSPGVSLIQKPITPGQLLRRLREVLDTSVGAPP